MKYEEIRQRLETLAARPPRDISADKMTKLYEEIRRKTPGSAALFERAKRAIPHGVQHMFSPAVPHPLFVEKAQGSKLTDVDGNTYIDYILAGGAVVLGHNPSWVNQRLIELLADRGSLHGLCDEFEILAAEKMVQHMPAVERVRFVQSGSEAAMATARLVRAYTGKKKIIKFRGAYHGWADQFATDMWVPGSGPALAGGIPPEYQAQTVLVYQNDLGELERAFQAHKDDVAAVFVEPLGAESGSLPLTEDFHQGARKLCHQYGALYVFDEVVTAFRLGLGGAQAYFGVDPDVTILGKAIMGGYPSCGAVGGKADIMDAFASPIAASERSVFVAGTLAANVLSSAACYFTLLALEESGAIEKAATTTDKLAAELNALFAAHGTGYFAYNFASILHVETAAPMAYRLDAPGGPAEIRRRYDCLEKYALVLRNEGILSLLGKGLLSAAHDESDITATVAAYEKLIDIMD
ncbi:MAG: aspartate aminotransferase family protein [Dehalococcoidia bacterium]